MKILGALLELPAKQHCQSSPFTSNLGQIGQIGSAVQLAPRIFFFRFNILILIYFFKYETISTFAPTFWTHIIFELDGVLG